MNDTWIQEIHIGDYVRLENLPYSQKHFENETLKHYFKGYIEGHIQYIQYDRIHLITNEGKTETFFPIPPLSGQFFWEIIDKSVESSF